MKLFTLLIFVSLEVLAVAIPVDKFDQSKLETILRQMPSAHINTQDMGDFVRKTYRFPTTKSKFSINCEADYYARASIPSDKKCTVTVSDKADLKGDEYLFKMTNTIQVSELFNAISYGKEEKKSYSHERVYGQAYEGNYRDLFRYMIICKKDFCDFRFTPKEVY